MAKKLPPRLTFNKKSGIYYYTPRVNGKIRSKNLGKDYPVAYAEYLKLEGVMKREEATVNELLDDYYVSEMFYDLADATQRRYIGRNQEVLRAAFGNMPASALTPQIISKFIMDHGQNANNWVSPLSNAFKLGVINGKVIKSPLATMQGFSGVQYARTNKREKEVLPEEVWAVYDQCEPAMQLFMEITMITGLRSVDVIWLNQSNIRERGLAVPIKKRARAAQVLLFRWTPRLRELADRLPIGLSKHQIRTRWIKACEDAGVVGLWKHDLRRFAIQQAVWQGNDPQKLAGHASMSQTETYLRGAPMPVQPLTTLDRT